MESNPVSPHPEHLRSATGGLFHPASMIQKSNRYQIEANNCFKNNKYKEAIDLFAQAIESNPVVVDPLCYLHSHFNAFF